MALFILDSDIASLYLRGQSAIVANITRRIEDTVAVPIVVAQEMLAGWLPILARPQSLDKVVQAYADFRRTLDFLADFPLLDFDRAAGERFEHLRQRFRRLGTNDLRIAAIALTTGGVLVTRNAVHFAQIVGLSLTDWSQA